MRCVDIFNGDADGLIAHHQYRLAFPVAAEYLSLITGTKRDVALVGRVDPRKADEVTIFDISYDQNAVATAHLLAQGIRVRYFDHHRADQMQAHLNLDAHIDTAPHICTSLLVDQFLGGRYRAWAITAAFGDNLIAVATQLAAAQAFSSSETVALRTLGECLNYNAYGECEEDLYFRPAELAARLAPYDHPFAFMQADSAYAILKAGFADVSGAFANHLAVAYPTRAHAVLTVNQDTCFTVSIRAPLAMARHADLVAIAFEGGGGRASAAGINRLASDQIAALAAKMEAVFGAHSSRHACLKHDLQQQHKISMPNQP